MQQCITFLAPPLKFRTIFGVFRVFGGYHYQLLLKIEFLLVVFQHVFPLGPISHMTLFAGVQFVFGFTEGIHQGFIAFGKTFFDLFPGFGRAVFQSAYHSLSSLRFCLRAAGSLWSFRGRPGPFHPIFFNPILHATDAIIQLQLVHHRFDLFEGAILFFDGVLFEGLDRLQGLLLDIHGGATVFSRCLPASRRNCLVYE